VIDTGVGIDPELLPRLFNPFEQGGRGVTRHYGGLGLGLVIGKAIAELHGGAVSAASPGPGRGTTLTVVLPLAASTAATTAASPWSAPGRPAAAPGRRAAASRILLVDDHPPTLRLLARLLRGLGHEVLTADGHDAALRAAEGYEVDLVISDIGLAESSGGTGWDLMRALSARRPLPAIALTGYGTEEDVRRSRAAGFREHLTKPLDLDRLNAAIGRVLGDSAPEAS
jgi:hypothetical protein